MLKIIGTNNQEVNLNINRFHLFININWERAVYKALLETTRERIYGDKPQSGGEFWHKQVIMSHNYEGRCVLWAWMKQHSAFEERKFSRTYNIVCLDLEMLEW